MSSHSRMIASAALLAVSACNPFRREPAVELTTADANRNSRWSGTLASPVQLAGAVQMTGGISMTPSVDRNTTVVSLELSNASPGGMHPWQLRRGQCGQDSGAVGTASAFKMLTVDESGRSNSTAKVDVLMPTVGDFYVSVGASSANPETVVACGNLAPPSR